MRRWAIGGALIALVLISASVVVALPMLARAERIRHDRAASALAAKRVATGLDAPQGVPTPPTPVTAAATESASATESVSATASTPASPTLEATSGAAVVRVSAPIAVRAGKWFRASGSAKGTSPGELVVISLEREFGSAWYVAATTTAPVDASGGFSASMLAPKPGHCRVTASTEATAGHAAVKSAKFPLKSVGPRVVALTFDDGPWPHTTDQIVGILKRYDVQATFFEIGEQVRFRPSRARTVMSGGNIIGVHTWHHDTLTKRSAKVNRADFLRCIATLRRATGVTPRWLRPPGGATNKAVAKTVRGVGLRQVLWTVDTLDWKNRNTPTIVKRAMKGVRPGGVVLMHDGGGPRAATVRAVPIIIKRLAAKNYDFVTLDELVALGYKPQ